jgi:hypothetical protein
MFSLVEVYGYFGKMCHLHLQGRLQFTGVGTSNFTLKIILLPLNTSAAIPDLTRYD